MVEGYEIIGMGGIANIMEAYLLSQENFDNRDETVFSEADEK